MVCMFAVVMSVCKSDFLWKEEIRVELEGER